MTSLSGRSRLRVLLFVVAVLAGCTGDDDAPNVILIVTDDQAEATLAHMPILQRELVHKGTTFPNFILNDPICCPSRVTILLGQYRHNHQLELGLGGCAFRFHEDHDGSRTIGALIQGAGYRTGMIGKYLNSYDRYYSRLEDRSKSPLLEGWDDWHVLAHRHPSYYGFYMHENGELVHHEEDPPLYQTDYLARLATGFIRRNAGREPFFLYVAPFAPHDPADPALRHRRNVLIRAPRGPAFNPTDVSSQPSLRRTSMLGPDELREVDLRFTKHVLTLQAVDEMVGAILAELEATGQLDRTFLFFTTDNGHHFGEHRIAGGKATPFEESIRFPLVVRGPGVPEGRGRSELVSNVDLHPTFLDLLGLPRDPLVDGRSLLPLLREGDPPPSWRRAVVIESVSDLRNEGVPPFKGLRTDRFKLVSYDDTDPDDGVDTSGERELYDLQRDPHETTNVLADADPALVAELEARLEALLRCHADGCREIENRPFAVVPPR